MSENKPIFGLVPRPNGLLQEAIPIIEQYDLMGCVVWVTIDVLELKGG